VGVEWRKVQARHVKCSETGSIRCVANVVHAVHIFLSKGCWARLVEEYPERAISWYAVGVYYTCIRQHDAARRYFGKATTLDPSFAAGWIGFGNAFAALDESDQVGKGSGTNVVG
jgi:hypothetical protein